MGGPDLPLSPMSPSKSGPIRGSSSNIHLWQFVKDLLNQPQHSSNPLGGSSPRNFQNCGFGSSCRIMGQTKNRPAMNFDKLSRSLRQYYKKGIMKKNQSTSKIGLSVLHAISFVITDYFSNYLITATVITFD